MSKKKIAYFYDADVGNYYYGQVSHYFLSRTRSASFQYSKASKLQALPTDLTTLSRATL